MNIQVKDAMQAQNRIKPVSFIGEKMATFYKAASESIRLDILRVLRSDSFGVVELANIFSMAQPGMSHHLKILSKAGLIQSRRQGNSIFYRRPILNEQSQQQRMTADLLREIDSLPIDSETINKISAIYKIRSHRSQAFFEKNADQFMAEQGLLCELNQYLAGMIDLLDLAKLSKNAHVLEVGPGHGEFLRELSGRYTNLSALDQSKKILDVAKRQMANRSEKINFICDSLESYKIGASQSAFDMLVLNMVLHHVSSPALAFQKARDLLAKDGYILIADLGSHNQDWVKKACGDTWLGFDSEEMDQWAIEAGFKVNQSLYLGLKNGFQIQLKLFQRS